MPNGKYTKEQVESAAQSMRVAILALVHLSSKRTKMAGGDFLKKSLIAGILEKGPEEVLFVKTVGDAARWDIVIYDAAEQFAKADTIDGMKNLCTTSIIQTWMNLYRAIQAFRSTLNNTRPSSTGMIFASWRAIAIATISSAKSMRERWEPATKSVLCLLARLLVVKTLWRLPRIQNRGSVRKTCSRLFYP